MITFSDQPASPWTWNMRLVQDYQPIQMQAVPTFLVNFVWISCVISKVTILVVIKQSHTLSQLCSLQSLAKVIKLEHVLQSFMNTCLFDLRPYEHITKISTSTLPYCCWEPLGLGTWPNFATPATVFSRQGDMTIG